MYVKCVMFIIQLAEAFYLVWSARHVQELMLHVLLYFGLF